MSTLHLRLPDDLKELAETRAAETGHASLEEYMAALIRADAEQDISEELEEAILEGLASGAPLEVTPQFWAEFKSRGHDRKQQARRP